MKTILVGILLVGATFALLPAADARQVCTYGGGDPCDDQAFCYWNRLASEPHWDCYVYVSPCLFRCWLP